MTRTVANGASNTGERIKVAARHLFARDGYAAVSMRQLAAEVGVQAGALYLHIPDKQSLLFDLLRENMETLLVAWDAEPRGEGPVGRLESFVRFHIRMHLDNPDSVFLANMELRNLTPENFAVIAGLRDQYEAELVAILRDGGASDEMRVPDAHLAAKALLAMLTGVSAWYQDGGRLSRDRVERIYWNMVRRAVGA
ncbi:TetR/AcrR family transcriptional regulator [Psychromarinibacter sp. S121]|uniref:TetR/AcrR family transcriptional regulator n=1 Tax=Psychromarinibacter sp. S121 TaxID=3415127 RepID=UPI003C7BBAB2